MNSINNQTYDKIETVIVDDKSNNAESIKKICKNYDVKYFRNTSNSRDSQRALARNIGLSRSSGELVVFSDMDIILPLDSIERHVSVHSKYQDIVLCSQIWNLNKDMNLNELTFTEEKLTSISDPFIHDPSIKWSDLENIYQSKNWWAFLSGNCSFKRHDIMRLNGWDPFFEGWGGEDNEMGYRIILNGLEIVYSDYVKAFHIAREVTPSEAFQKEKSVLKNINYMCKKFPELNNYDRLIERRNQVKELVNRMSQTEDKARPFFKRLFKRVT